MQRQVRVVANSQSRVELSFFLSLDAHRLVQSALFE